MHWYLAAWKKYCVFSGRARRKEYWMFTFSCIIMTFIFFLVMRITGSHFIWNILYGSLMLAAIVPGFAVAIRRLHDINRSGWWMLISLIPGIGGLVMFVFMVMDSYPGDNAYGPNPKIGQTVV